jgi:1-acyl-sn-glycerol-3-phosphate acyltransferase
MKVAGQRSLFIPARKNFLGELLVFWICRSSLWRSFHSVKFLAAAPLVAPPSQLDAPVIFYANHNSWWDGYLAHLINQQVYGLDGYLMMDVRQLQRYSFFSWAGCFSVDQQDARSAVRSLDYITNELKAKPGRSLWIFPQGRILPQAQRPLDFHSGLAHLIKRLGTCYVYPVATRLEFLAEQYPDIFIEVGPAQRFEAVAQVDPKALTLELEQALTNLLDSLNTKISQQELTDFITLVAGKSSTNTSFDRLLKSFKILPVAKKP